MTPSVVLDNGLTVLAGVNPRVSIPEWWIVQTGSGIRVATIGRRDESVEVAAAAVAEHFTLDYSRDADDLRSDLAVKCQVSSVWKVYAGLSTVRS